MRKRLIYVLIALFGLLGATQAVLAATTATLVASSPTVTAGGTFTVTVRVTQDGVVPPATFQSFGGGVTIQFDNTAFTFNEAASTINGGADYWSATTDELLTGAELVPAASNKVQVAVGNAGTKTVLYPVATLSFTVAAGAAPGDYNFSLVPAETKFSEGAAAILVGTLNDATVAISDTTPPTVGTIQVDGKTAVAKGKASATVSALLTESNGTIGGGEYKLGGATAPTSPGTAFDTFAPVLPSDNTTGSKALVDISAFTGTAPSTFNVWVRAKNGSDLFSACHPKRLA